MPQAIFTDYKLDKLSRDKAMREVYAEVTRQCKLSDPTVEGEMMNNALQEVILMRKYTKSDPGRIIHLNDPDESIH